MSPSGDSGKMAALTLENFAALQSLLKVNWRGGDSRRRVFVPGTLGRKGKTKWTLIWTRNSATTSWGDPEVAPFRVLKVSMKLIPPCLDGGGTNQIADVRALYKCPLLKVSRAGFRDWLRWKVLDPRCEFPISSRSSSFRSWQICLLGAHTAPQVRCAFSSRSPEFSLTWVRAKTLS